MKPTTGKLIAGKPQMIVVLGPTATGKSDFAVQIALEIAKKFDKKINGKGQIAEIISADSRQIYKGLNIGSGKITEKEMLGVPHHGLDIVTPKRRQLFSVAEFQTYAIQKAHEIISRGNIPILCGGTGFYIQSVVDGIIFPDVAADHDLRKKLGSYPKERLQKMLAKLDPKRFAEIDKDNPVRLIRAIEIAKAIGKSPAIVRDAEFDVLQIGLDMNDEKMKSKIRARILARLTKGMVREAKSLHTDGLTFKRMRKFGLEYRLLADVLQGKMTRAQFIERLSFDIWHYVKRQRAWFKRDGLIIWIDPSKKSSFPKVMKRVRGFLKR